MPSILRLTFAAALFSAAAPAIAQDVDAPRTTQTDEAIDTGRNTVTIGAGVATVPSYEGSNTNRFVPVGAARGSIDGFSFSTRGTKLFVDLVPNKPGPVVDFQAGPVVSLDFNRVSGIRDDRVEALGKKKLAVEVGGFVGIGKTGVITSPYDKISISASYIHDVTGVHGSYIISPEINYTTPLSRKAFVGVSGSASYAGRGYARSYFTVTPTGSLASGLPVYYAGKGWKNYSVSGLAGYSLSGDLLHGLALVGGVSYSRLLDDFAASPIVSIAGKRDQWYGAVGLAYTF